MKKLITIMNENKEKNKVYYCKVRHLLLPFSVDLMHDRDAVSCVKKLT